MQQVPRPLTLSRSQRGISVIEYCFECCRLIGRVPVKVVELKKAKEVDESTGVHFLVSITLHHGVICVF